MVFVLAALLVGSSLVQSSIVRGAGTSHPGYIGPSPRGQCAAPLAHSAGNDRSSGVQYYVDATKGSDDNAGTSADKPFQTLAHARSVVQTVAGTVPVTVNVASGDYYPGDAASTATLDVPVLSLGPEDSGTAENPIVWQAATRAVPGATNARFVGGAVVPANSWVPAATKNAPSLMAANLTESLGLTKDDFGGMQTGGLGDCAWNQAGVFIGGTRGILARYPNIVDPTHFGWAQISSVVNANTTFVYTDDRISEWADAPNAWLHGYWGMGWADNYVHVTGVDPATKVVSVDEATPPTYGFKPKARFYGVNILSEADVPLEYYINQTTGTLFVVPPTSDPKLASTEVIISIRNQILNITGASFVTVDGFEAQYARGTGLQAKDLSNVRVSNCLFDNQGAHAASFSGTNSTLEGCSIQHIGCSAVSVNGGDPNALVAGGVTIANNTISQYALWKRTYNAGVGFGGMGNFVVDNEIYNAPHTGIIGGGNDYIFQGNYLHDLAYEVTDSGAWYSGRSWAKRGNVIRGNTFERVQNNQPTYLGAPSVQAVYFDDELSGQVCDSNTFIDCHAGIMLGGGRHVDIKNNTFVRVGTGILFDNRGEGWQKNFCEPGGNVSAGPFMTELFAHDFRNPPWSTHYPELLSLPGDHPCQTCYNNISDNTYCNTTFINQDAKTIASWFSTAENNVEKC